MGTDKGVVACVSLYDAAKNDQKEITLSTTNSASTDFLLRGKHTSEVSETTHFNIFLILIFYFWNTLTISLNHNDI